MYTAFVDFRKAFDLTYRNGIWFKLIDTGVSGKMLKILRSMYEGVKLCVRNNGSLTDFFDSYMGLKQGEPLSPFLFIMFINDMQDHLADDSIDVFTIEELQIYLLLFADDTALFSYSEQGLQILLNKLYNYCRKWGIEVNSDKTVVMVFRQGNRPSNISLKYDNKILKQVKTFTYLGVTLSSNGSFYQAQKSLSAQALKALYSLNSLFDNVNLDIEDKLKLFNSMVLPILCYGSEIWGFHKSPDIERVYLKFLKQILGVKQQTCSTAVYGEFGVFPLYIVRKIRIIKFWYKIKNMPDSTMYKLMMLQGRNNTLLNSWSCNVKKLLDDLGFSYLWNCDRISEMNVKLIIQRIHDQYLQQWLSELGSSSKLDYYREFKLNFIQASYLNTVNVEAHMKALARFRCSSHNLEIEEGRYRNIIRSERLCRRCNMNQVESEYHFLLICPFYRELRLTLLDNYYYTWPNMNKFNKLMSTTKRSVIIKLAKFVYLALKKRNESVVV